MSSKSPQDAGGTRQTSHRERDGVAPSPEVIEVFCQYLRQLEVAADTDWNEFVQLHEVHAADLELLLEQYERVSAILERLQPSASFSARLRQHYGEGIDPGISLSGGRSRATDKADSSSRSAGRVLKRLSAQNPSLSRYEMRQEIARGGMGAIMEVWDKELRRTLAMKVVLGGKVEPGSSQSSEELAERRLSRFLEEAQITGQLDHPGIVPVHDIGIDESARVYFTMQLIDGSDLRKVFEFARMERHNWNQRRVISVLVRVCEAMAYAHSKHVVHRDLKPANIMVGAFGEAYVMDWGLAKVLNKPPVESAESTERRPRKDHKIHTDRSDRNESDTDSDAALMTLDGDIVGTPAYMAPEQARGQIEEIAAHSDIYSMGAMMYHLITGQAPYEPLGEKVPAHTILEAVRKAPPWPLRRLEPNVDAELAAICDKAMAREPALRYESMLALAEDLRAWVEGRGVGAYTTGVWYETRKWMRRNLLTSIALGSIAFLLAVSIALFIYLQQTNISKLDKETLAKDAALDEARVAKAEAESSAKQAREREFEMKREKDRADLQAQQAQEAKQRADFNSTVAQQQTVEADVARKRATATAYRSSVNAAAFSLRLDELEAVRRNLDACDVSMRGWEWNHLDLSARVSVGPATVLDEGVTDLAVGKDGATLLTYGFGLQPQLWDVATRRMLPVQLPGPTYFRFTPQTNLERWRCALSPSGGLVAVTNPSDNSLRMMNSKTGELLYSSIEHNGAVTAVVFSPDGNVTATSSEDGTIVLMDTASARVLQRLTGHTGIVYDLAFSPIGERIVSGGADRTVRVWSVATGEEQSQLSGHHDLDVVAVDWSPDDEHIVSASLDGSLAVWACDRETMSAVMHGHRGAIHDVIFSRDGRSLFSGGDDRTVRMFDADSGKELRVFSGHEQEVRALVRLGDAESIASVSLNGTLRIWDPRWDPALTRVDLPGAGDCNQLAFDPSGRRLLAQINGKPVAMIDADRGIDATASLGAGTVSSAEPAASSKSHVAMAVARTNGRIAVATPERRIEVYSADFGELEHTFDGFGSAVTRLAISNDGRRLAAGSSRRQVFFIDVEAGTTTKIELESNLVALAVSPDGEFIVTAQSDESLQLWKAADGTALIRHRDAHSSRINCMQFSPDGNLLVTGSADRTARVWSLPDMEFLAPELTGHNQIVSAVAFSPVDDRVVTGTDSGILRVWNLETHELLYQRAAHSGRVLDISFSADGRRMATTGAGRDITVWESDRADERYSLRFGTSAK